VVYPVAGPDLTISAVARWNVVSFWLWEELPIEGFVGRKWKSVIGSKLGKACRHLAEGCSEAGAISAVFEKMQTTETSVPVVCCSPRTGQWCHIRRRVQAREEHVDKIQPVGFS
jgi:hypothetical protein